MIINFENSLRMEDCVLHSIGHGRIDADTPYSMPECSKFYELIIITKGECVIVTADMPVTLKENDAFLAFPFDVYNIQVKNSDAVEYDYIGFSVNSHKFGNEFNKIWSESIATSARFFSNSMLAGIISCMYTEIEDNEKAFSKELVSLLCSQMLVYILRAFGEKNAERKDEIGTNFDLCSVVMNYIDTNLYSMKSLADMASDLGYNYSYLSTVFHKTTHTTLNSYYKTKRMDAARTLLLEKQVTISKIAEIMNYSSVYAFSKAFKEFFGSSPGKYSGRFEKKEK